MIIYGVALLAFCFLTGNYIGDFIGNPGSDTDDNKSRN